jgi:hypothetical protein
MWHVPGAGRYRPVSVIDHANLLGVKLSLRMW